MVTRITIELKPELDNALIYTDDRENLICYEMESTKELPEIIKEYCAELRKYEVVK